MIKITNWKILNQIEDGCGGVIYKILGAIDSGLKNVEISMCIFGPGEIAETHYHNLMEEIYFVIEGHGEIEIDNKWHRVKAEDCIAIPSKALHRIRNSSKELPLRFLSINSPQWSDDDMIRVKSPDI